MKHAILFGAALVGLTACTGNNKSQSEEPQTSSLIIYYSQTGATQQVANLLQQKTGADIEALQVVNPYDGDFNQTIARCQEEMASGKTPELKPLAHAIADYDTIYIGYPVWFGTYAMPIATLVKENDFSGKVIVPFCTFGSGGNTSITALQAALPNIKEMLPYYGVRAARVSKASSELDTYLVSAGILSGEVEEHPAFGEQQPLTEADQIIFNEACGSYQMPLGTPVSVSSITSDAATNYLFTVESAGADGQVQVAQIYVVKDNAEGAVAEFTQVIR